MLYYLIEVQPTTIDPLVLNDSQQLTDWPAVRLPSEPLPMGEGQELVGLIIMKLWHRRFSITWLWHTPSGQKRLKGKS